MDLPFAARLLAIWARKRVARRPLLPLEELDLSSIRRVMLVLTTGIGDAIFSSAAFPSLRAALPQAEIRLFCRDAWTSLFRGDSNLDGVINYHGKFRKFFSTLRLMRAFAPELTVVLHGNDPDVIPMAILAGSRWVVRIPTTGTKFSDLLSNANRVQDRHVLQGLHYVDNRLRILDTLGIPSITDVPSIAVGQEAQSTVDRLLRDFFQGSPFWILHIHAADPYKTLPFETASDAITLALKTFPEIGIVLSGGHENRDDLLRLIPKESENRVLVTAGKFSLGESAACIARSVAVVAPDTGILHLAAALDRPVIGLFAPTDPVLVGPRAATATVNVLRKPVTCDPCVQKQCQHRPVLCMRQFNAGEIVELLKDLIT